MKSFCSTLWRFVCLEIQGVPLIVDPAKVESEEMIPNNGKLPNIDLTKSSTEKELKTLTVFDKITKSIPQNALMHMSILPYYFERLLFHSVILCLDSALFEITYMPIQAICVASHYITQLYEYILDDSVKITSKTFTPEERGESARKDLCTASNSITMVEFSGCIRFMILCATVFIFSMVDTSRVYHSIRGQPFIKLYVIFNILEICERLCRSFSRDIIDNLFRTAIEIYKNINKCNINNTINHIYVTSNFNSGRTDGDNIREEDNETPLLLTDSLTDVTGNGHAGSGRDYDSDIGCSSKYSCNSDVDAGNFQDDKSTHAPRSAKNTETEPCIHLSPAGASHNTKVPVDHLRSSDVLSSTIEIKVNTNLVEGSEGSSPQERIGLPEEDSRSQDDSIQEISSTSSVRMTPSSHVSDISHLGDSFKRPKSGMLKDLLSPVVIRSEFMRGIYASSDDNISYSASPLPELQDTVQDSLVFFKFFVLFVIVVSTFMLHSLLHLVRVLSLNIAINSSEAIIFLLLITNNFAEIKSTVFKKYTYTTLFVIAASDAVERCYLCLDGLVIILKISTSMRHLRVYMSVLGWLLLILFMEMMIDLVKHLYLLKFNKISSDIFKEYHSTLLADFILSRCNYNRKSLISSSFNVPCKGAYSFSHISSRRLGFIATPILTLLICSLPKFSNSLSISNFISILLIWLSLFAIKTTTSILLTAYSIRQKANIYHLHKSFETINAL